MISKVFFGFLKILSFFICFALFLLLMIDVWQKFSDGMTNMGSRFYDQGVDKKNLPCFTICPFSAYKRRGLPYSNRDFVLQTFE
jgi:hypothetical protein